MTIQSMYFQLKIRTAFLPLLLVDVAFETLSIWTTYISSISSIYLSIRSSQQNLTHSQIAAASANFLRILSCLAKLFLFDKGIQTLKTEIPIWLNSVR